MNCKEVHKKLPEYLAGILDDNTRTQVNEHLKTCSACSMELKELNSNVAPDMPQVKEIDEKRIIRKAKMKFNLAIIKTVAAVVLVLLLISLIPTFLWGIQSVSGQPKASRALMDAVQFSQPSKVNMWGNTVVQGLSLSVPLKIGARPVIGRGYRGQFEFTGNMSVITGKVTTPVFLGANFVHPALFSGEDLGHSMDKDTQIRKLEKNAETTVAVVDYSLNEIISLSDVEDLIRKYDVEVCWIAVEAGIEDTKSKNMSFGNQQILQWGIPGTLSRPGRLNYIQLKSGNVKEFEKAVIDELKWLDANRGILKPDPGLLKDNGVDNSVKGQARYILENGIRIYGLRLTGPSNELMRLRQDLDVRALTVVDMDFWNW